MRIVFLIIVRLIPLPPPDTSPVVKHYGPAVVCTFGSYKERVCGTHGSNDVRNVGHCGARGSSQVHDLGSRLDVDLVNSSQDGRSQLGAERIPGSVFNLSLSFLPRPKRTSTQIVVTTAGRAHVFIFGIAATAELDSLPH